MQMWEMLWLQNNFNIPFDFTLYVPTEITDTGSHYQKGNESLSKIKKRAAFYKETRRLC